MKKVVNPTENTITLQEVLNKDYPIIGFKFGDEFGDDKITLVPLKYGSKMYFARCVDAWEKGNGFDPNGLDNHTIKEWEEFFRINYKSEMFVFDSPKELFAWLAE
jgi:hypothetical protein